MIEETLESSLEARIKVGRHQRGPERGLKER